jgi:UDP-glucose 4-epimerase
MSTSILISGGAGYIGSHAAFVLKQTGYEPVIIDNLATGNAWAASHGVFEQGDIGDTDFVRTICEKYRPVAAMHFAAFIEVGESVKNPAKYDPFLSNAERLGIEEHRFLQHRGRLR